MVIKAAIPSLYGGSFEIAPLELRRPGPEEVLVRIVSCGVCHTDMAMMNGSGLMVLGHEGSGVVEAVGPDAGDLRLGDHVVLSYPSCGACEACRDSRPYDCVYFSDLFMGDRLRGTIPLRYNGRIVTPFFGQGSFATFSVVHKSSAVKVPKDADLKLLGPLGCGVQTGAGAVLNYLKPRPGKAIAIFGTGSVGLSAVIAARIAGCAPIIAVDRLEPRLALAGKFGATHTVNSAAVRDVRKEILQISGGIRYALDTTGSMALMNVAMSCLLPGGRGCGVAAAGRPRVDREASAESKHWDEIIQGCAVPQVFIPRMIDYWKKGRFPFEEMLTFFKFEDINEAFRKAEAFEVVKPVLVMQA
ncbi:aryl-alcohol dehydrogenase [Sporobacter termitidis DSM 10068]|uniref:Aryl-alcohol dehydrogenase n=1 Tax=Sporobacter termitidis DSM 10068 TaxID=1123282 RepID=A0A1M5Z9E4_9FIRM|nr:NAD(P)-dependent alcohol dehydrogenase [Sporobacter termitidis]SHI20845.1 aryl-alcohol dehydrogenase [Sporobacter termitidis DSM 10068]